MKMTFRRGSICAWRSLETGISPDGSVSLVLSMYIGLRVGRETPYVVKGPYVRAGSL